MPAYAGMAGQHRFPGAPCCQIRRGAGGRRGVHLPAPAALSRMRRRGAKRASGMAGDQPAAVIAFAEMWTHQQAWRRGKRQDMWVRAAVVSDPAGCRWAEFEIGDRSEKTFLRRYERLPAAELYRTDGTGPGYVWLPADHHQAGKGGAVNWNEVQHSWCRAAEPAASETQGYTKSLAMPACSLALSLAGWPSQSYASLY